jgi:Ca-activated chloride channel family protein
MEWQHPEALYLILPLCAAWFVLAHYSNRRRHLARETFAAAAMWSRILPEESRLRFWVKLTLREIAIIAGLVALAGPRFGMQYEQVVPRGSDLYVLIDVSRSMLADDVPPSRLGRAKADVSSLVNRLEGERVGLIAFAGQAVVKCPLTVDYDSFRRALDELDPDSAPRGGTAIGDAIRKAIEVFHAKSDRDQAVLLITDGDDQQSYPLEAAAVAAERHVTIFTVGLGDTERGARVPQKGNASTYVEYEGQQVWSKLDSDLLQQIALKTNGVYVPAGTRAYDLGELYTNHLQGRRSNDATAQQRIRRSERFQIFLGIALVSLLIDLCIGTYRRPARSKVDDEESDDRSRSVEKKVAKSGVSIASIVSFAFLTLTSGLCGVGLAIEPDAAVREGLRLYSSEKFEEAREKFAAAGEELDKQKSAATAIAAFDEACAYHRKGDTEHARDCYLRAGLSPDLAIATASHFNLGNLCAEKARTLSGDKPETVPPDKRQEILDQLSQAVAAYRHCLELNHSHSQSRRNLELVRQWIKHYSDRWRELDRQKRRDESNLLQFLEYLIATETGLRETVKNLREFASADAFAELKRVQDELSEEVPTLREKIATELRPPQDPKNPAPQNDSKEVEEGISLLQSWADTAGQKMAAASRQLSARVPDKAAVEQKAAIEEMDKIWEAVIPFHPLLARELSDQSSITKSLSPNASGEEQPAEAQNEKHDSTGIGNLTAPLDEPLTEPKSQTQNKVKDSPQLETANADLIQLEEQQTRTLNRARMLAPKAEAELQRLESMPPPQAPADENAPQDPAAGAQPQQVDPEQIKEGYRKAIELAPHAVEQMEAAVKAIRQKDRQSAGQRAEEARKILEEIQQAQPKNQQQQDQQKNDEQNQNQDDKSEDQKKDEQKKDDKKDEQQSQDEQKKQEQKKPQPQVSQDRIEDALRKVRERQQEKRERDKKFKGQFLGKAPVDKDW